MELSLDWNEGLKLGNYELRWFGLLFFFELPEIASSF